MSFDLRVYNRFDGKWMLVVGEGEEVEFNTEGEARMAQREQEYIAAARAANRKIWDGINELKALQVEWNALDYATTLDEGTGENAGVTAVEVGAVVFDTANAMSTLLAGGHATNMAKLL
jgi:hypothetical protein